MLEFERISAVMLNGEETSCSTFIHPFTTIEYALPGRNHIEITVFDLLGRKVRNLVAGEKNAGTHRVTWNGLDNSGSPVSSGVYYYTMTAEGFTETRTLLLIR